MNSPCLQKTTNLSPVLIFIDFRTGEGMTIWPRSPTVAVPYIFGKGWPVIFFSEFKYEKYEISYLFTYCISIKKQSQAKLAGLPCSVGSGAESYLKIIYSISGRTPSESLKRLIKLNNPTTLVISTICSSVKRSFIF